MKRRAFLFVLLLIFIVEIITLIYYEKQDIGNDQDAVAVNEALQSVQTDWGSIENHINQTSLDYVVLDAEGILLYETKDGLSESINAAIVHRDTILDIEADGSAVGKLIIYNDNVQIFRSWKQNVFHIVLAAILVQCGTFIFYIFYLNRTIIKPFQNLKGFAKRIADGNLDVPLKMDRQNIFGAFTESFDIMRTELKQARIAEAEANASKQELVANLSHDIKTPVASIKAAAEVGAVLTDNEKIRDNYAQIIGKADQINALISQLFSATLEELQQLPVNPKDMESSELKMLLENADYQHMGIVPDIPDCLLYADKLRLQQVFDNLFANSYKYANTKIDITIDKDEECLGISVEDYGGGVDKEELPFLKEKFKRGSNTENIDGAGLGLYISDYFMKGMKGRLVVENGLHGLKVTVWILFSHKI